MQIQLQNIELYCRYSPCFMHWGVLYLWHDWTCPFCNLVTNFVCNINNAVFIGIFFRTICKSGAYGTGSSCSSLLLWTSFYDGSSATIYLIYCASIFNWFQQSGTVVSLNIKVQFKASYCHCLVCLVSTRLVRSMLGKEIYLVLWPCPSFGVPVL